MDLPNHTLPWPEPARSAILNLSIFLPSGNAYIYGRTGKLFRVESKKDANYTLLVVLVQSLTIIGNLR